jgi:conjugal transfer pilus assembly protein TraK
LQLVDASDGVAVEALLSIREPTRIRIDGVPIVDVFGNIHSSGCAETSALPGMPNGLSAQPAAPYVNPDGEIVIECDKAKGEIYVRPVGTSEKPVNLFVSSMDATYTLVLRRSDTPADTIVIRDRGAAERRAAGRASASACAPSGTSSHVRNLKAMLVTMATDRVPSDIAVRQIGLPVTLWRETSLQFERTYSGRGLVGERYQIQNVSAKPLVLTEPEFDREGNDAGSVAAIAIERHNLAPGERTRVFIIRTGKQP